MVENITMNIDEKLELDYLVEEINENAVTVDDQPNSDSTSLDYIKRKSSVFNPSDAGSYTLNVNGQKIEIEVIDIPASAVFNIKARNYDGSKYVANIGPDLSDAKGNPTTTTVSIGGDNFTTVRYNRSTPDISQTTTQIATGDPIAIVYSVAIRSPDIGSSSQHYLDTDTKDDFAHLLNSGSPNPHRILSGSFNVDAQGNDADNNFHTFVYQISSNDGGKLDRDESNFLSDSSATDPSLDGFTLGGRGDLGSPSDLDVLEVTVLDSATSSEVSNEAARQRSVYNI